MKKGLFILSVLFAFSSCDVWVVEAPFDARDNFVGRFNVDEYSETYDLLSQYRVRIFKDADPFSNIVYIRNFYALELEIFAEVIGNRLTIPTQEIDGYLIQGTGRLELGEVALSYSVEDLIDNRRLVDFCNTIYFRR